VTEFGDGAGEHVLDQEPLGAPSVAQVVEEADDGDHVRPRVVGGTGRVPPQGGEPLGRLGAEGQQVHPAVRHVGHRRAGACGLPVDHPGYVAPSPQHVAGMEVAVQHHRRQAGRGPVVDLRGPLPHCRVSRPGRRLVAGLRAGGERPDQAGRRERCGMDGRQDPGKAPQPPAGIRWPPVNPAGQPRHEHRRYPGPVSGRVDPEQRRGRHADGPGDAKRPCLACGDVRFLRVEFRPYVAAQHRLPALPCAVLRGEQVHGRGHPAAQRPGRGHRAAELGGGPGQRLPRRPGVQQPPGHLVIAEPVGG